MQNTEQMGVYTFYSQHPGHSFSAECTFYITWRRKESKTRSQILLSRLPGHNLVDFRLGASGFFALDTNKNVSNKVSRLSELRVTSPPGCQNVTIGRPASTEAVHSLWIADKELNEALAEEGSQFESGWRENEQTVAHRAEPALC